jgi:hypothetical protein
MPILLRSPAPVPAAPRPAHPRVGRATRALVAVALVAVTVAARPAHAAEPGTITDADATIEQLRREADDLAARYFDLLARSDRLDREAAALEARLPALAAEQRRLREVVRERAVVAYRRRGQGMGAWLNTRSPLDRARRLTWLETVNAADNRAVDELGALTDRLREERQTLRDAQAKAVAALDDARAQGDAITARLVEAENRRAELEAGPAAEETTTTTRSPLTGSTTTTRPGTSPTTAPVQGPTSPPPNYVPTPGTHPRHDEPFLVCTRTRESGGNYSAVNPAGPYLGAYQFLQSTWNASANHAGRTDLIGVPANLASPYDQDDVAWALYQWQGARPWGNLCV